MTLPDGGGSRLSRFGAFALLALLAACAGDDAAPLPGERRPVRVEAPPPAASPETARELAPLGPARTLPEWTQPNAVATRAPGHIEGPAGLSEAWRADIGEGETSRGRLTSAPVVAGGRVFTLDAAATVSAFDVASGRRAWRARVAPEGEDPDDGFGGGLAAAGGRLFVTTGFGETLALDMATGEILWRRDLGAPVRAAPAIDQGALVVVTRDDAGYGLDPATGEILWRAQSTGSGVGVLGGGSPAVSGPVAVLPFSSGDLVAVSSFDGRRLWSEALRGGRRGAARSAVTDVAGGPAIVGVGVFAANQSGQLAAIDGRTGRRGWTAEIGSINPVWAVGPTLFVIDVDGRLTRLASPTGERLWTTQLPVWEDPEDFDDPIAYGGPVVAGERLYLTSSAGALLVFDPLTGERLTERPLAGGSVTGPVIADRTLYVVTDAGVLQAFR